MTRPRLTIVSSHVRRAPSDRYAAIRAEKTAELFNDVHGEMLERALLMMDLSDIQRDRIEESF